MKKPKKNNESATVRIPKHHTSIETLSIAAWWAIEENNDLGSLFVFPRKMKPAELPKLMLVWDRIMDEFVDTFGINPNYKTILNLRCQIRLCEIEYEQSKTRENPNGDRIWITEKNIYERELKELVGEKKKANNDESLVYASKFMGYNINENQTSVKRFFTILQTMDKAVPKKSNGR